MDKKPVIVTTEFRGVFFGYLTESDAPTKVVLERARNCVSWTNQVKGVFGLAATGPDGSCRIGPSVPSIELWKITSVTECTPAAAEKWESGPWTR